MTDALVALAIAHWAQQTSGLLQLLMMADGGHVANNRSHGWHSQGADWMEEKLVTSVCAARPWHVSSGRGPREDLMRCISRRQAVEKKGMIRRPKFVARPACASKPLKNI
jgi:hypothetical protein